MYHHCTPEIARALLELPYLSGPDQKLLDDYLSGAFLSREMERNIAIAEQSMRDVYDELSDLIQSRFQELAAKGVV